MSEIDWKTHGEVAVGFTDQGEVVVVARPGISRYHRAILTTPTDRVVGDVEVPREVALEAMNRTRGGAAERHLLEHLRADRLRRAHAEPITWNRDA